MRILAGDVGGTKTSLAIFEIGRRGRSVVRSERYPSRAHSSLEEVVDIFLRGEAAQAAAGFGVAGPVRDGAAKITNLPWRIEESRLERATGIPRVVLLNDFVSNARGLPFLRGRQLATLARGRPEPGGPIGILGAGTGLGQACLVPRAATRISLRGIRSRTVSSFSSGARPDAPRARRCFRGEGSSFSTSSSSPRRRRARAAASGKSSRKPPTAPP